MSARRMSFVIDGIPLAWARARQQAQVNGKPMFFNNEKQVSYCGQVKMAYRAACGKEMPPPHDQGVLLTVTGYWPVPKSKPKGWKAAAEAGKKYRLGKPDSDNLAKQIGDSLNGVAWTDDSRIADARGRKFYSTRPRLEVEIVFLDGDDVDATN